MREVIAIAIGGALIALLGMAMNLEVATAIGGGILIVAMLMWFVVDYRSRDAERNRN